MKLSAYMADNGLDDAAMAEKIGQCSEFAVRKWKYGERVPRPDHLRRISSATEGRVRPADFIDMPDEAAAPQ
ncbi:helix-turn-helix domain-containing protein [Rhodoblastus sp.]|uniref:helix-turn-helix domain-containing protein n=1 Tax=Rhodoblastus sp. TaxID=1962975 RepID=UPI003F943A81